MANSFILNRAKNKIVREMIKSPEIIQAIDSSSLDPNNPEEYIGTHIFDYGQNPSTLETVETFITVQVHIPNEFFRTKPFVRTMVEIWIFSHHRHLKVDNVPKVTSNRNDYLSELIDKMLNGRLDFGIGELTLVTNVEGEMLQKYMYRRMEFQGLDINDSVCEDT